MFDPEVNGSSSRLPHTNGRTANFVAIRIAAELENQLSFKRFLKSGDGSSPTLLNHPDFNRDRVRENINSLPPKVLVNLAQNLLSKMLHDDNRLSMSHGEPLGQCYLLELQCVFQSIPVTARFIDGLKARYLEMLNSSGFSIDRHSELSILDCIMQPSFYEHPDFKNALKGCVQRELESNPENVPLVIASAAFRSIDPATLRNPQMQDLARAAVLNLLTRDYSGEYETFLRRQTEKPDNTDPPVLVSLSSMPPLITGIIDTFQIPDIMHHKLYVQALENRMIKLAQDGNLTDLNHALSLLPRDEHHLLRFNEQSRRTLKLCRPIVYRELLKLLRDEDIKPSDALLAVQSAKNFLTYKERGATRFIDAVSIAGLSLAYSDHPSVSCGMLASLARLVPRTQRDEYCSADLRASAQGLMIEEIEELNRGTAELYDYLRALAADSNGMPDATFKDVGRIYGAQQQLYKAADILGIFTYGLDPFPEDLINTARAYSPELEILDPFSPDSAPRVRRDYSSLSIISWSASVNEAMRHYVEGKPRLAELIATRAYRALLHVDGLHSDPELVGELLELCAITSSNSQRAEDFYRRALFFRMHTLGLFDPAVGETFAEFAIALSDRSKDKQAENLFDMSCKIRAANGIGIKKQPADPEKAFARMKEAFESLEGSAIGIDDYSMRQLVDFSPVFEAV